MKLVEGKFGRQPCTDLAERLRALADAVDRGEITDLVAAYVDTTDDSYSFLWAASMANCVAMATLMQHKAVGRIL